MWVFKTAGASMKGSQVGNRSAGRIGTRAGDGHLTAGNGFAEYCLLAMFYIVFRGERIPNDGERIYIILHFSYVFIRIFAGNGHLAAGNGFAEYCILATFYKVFSGERGPNT